MNWEQCYYQVFVEEIEIWWDALDQSDGDIHVSFIQRSKFLTKMLFQNCVRWDT